MIIANNIMNKTPLSELLNTRAWDDSVLGSIAYDTDQLCYLEKEPVYRRVAPGCWRVVFAYWNPEDQLITRFVATKRDGSIVYMPFGVHYSSLPEDRNDIIGYYEFPPQHRAYLFSDGVFPTYEESGYSVRVLDPKYPSEIFHFGMSLKGQHKCLTIGFMLFTA